MSKRSQAGAALFAAALCLQACSSRPRSFDPVLDAAPADQAAFEADLAECRQVAAQGLGADADRTASGGAGVAAGAATGAAGTAVATGTAGMGGFAVMGATIVLAPFAVMGAAWGLAKAKKNRKEQTIKAVEADCLGNRGYLVTDWVRASEKRDDKRTARLR